MRTRLWGVLRIHGELLKFGIDIGETSVSEYLVRGRKPPSQTWLTFLENHRLRDRDKIFGPDFVKQVKAMGIKQVLSASRSPWQRAYIERVIGTLRGECLDPVIVFSEAGLYRHHRNFADYYHPSRTHLGWQKDTSEPGPIQPPDAGRIIAIPEVGGLHPRYERRAA